MSICAWIEKLRVLKIFFFFFFFYPLQVIVNLLRPFFFKTTKQGAQTTIYCAVSEEMEGVTGQYMADCKIQRPVNPQAIDDELAEQLLEASAKTVGLYFTLKKLDFFKI